MNSFAFVVAFCVCAAIASPIEDGRWNPYKYGDNGKYIPTDEGKYIHIPNPYIHLDNPYDGGYGPYAHEYEPYEQSASQDVYKLVLQAPQEYNPYYKDGYYKNNGIKILNQKHNYNEDKYDFVFETENKIRAKENAVLKNANTIDEGIASKGFYEYIGPDGFMYRVDYTADENGFRPKLKSFETENKIRAKENAVLKNANTIDEGIASKGFYEYIGPDGFMYRVDYTADENGFRPKLKRLETPYSGKWVLEKVN